MQVVSSGRFSCRVDLRCGLRLYRRDVGEATLPQQLPESHTLMLSQPVRFQSGLSQLLDSHWAIAQYKLLTKRCTGTVGLAYF